MAEQADEQNLPEIDEQIVASGGQQGQRSVRGGPVAADLGLILEVPLRLSVELGSANLPVRAVLALTKGSIVELDRMSGEPADVYANDRLLARGEVVMVDDHFGIRVTAIVDPRAREAVVTGQST